MQSFTVTGLTFNTDSPVSASYVSASNIDGIIPSASYASTASYVGLPDITDNANHVGINQPNPTLNLDVYSPSWPYVSTIGNSSGSLAITAASVSGSQDIEIVPSVGINPIPGNVFIEGGSANASGSDAGVTMVAGGYYYLTGTSAPVLLNPNGRVGINLGLSGSWINRPSTNYTLEVSGTIGSSHGDLTLQMDGDVYGSSKLHLWNRAGSNGAVFENPSDSLCDFGFLTLSGTSKQNNIRLEQRNGYTTIPANNPASGGYGEFQFSCNTGYNEFFLVGNNGAAFQTGKVGIQTTNPAYTLDVHGDVNTTGVFRKNGAPLIQAGTASFSLTGVINFATAFANTNYSVVVSPTAGTNTSFMVGPKTTTSCGFTASVIGSGTVNFIATGYTQ